MKRFVVSIFIVLLTQTAQAYEMPKSFSHLVDKVKSTYQEWKLKIKVAINSEKNAVPAEKQEVVKAASDLKEAAEKIKEIQVSRSVKPAEETKDKNLKINNSLVHVYDFKKDKKQTIGQVKYLPLLRLGEEASLDAAAFVPVNISSIPLVTGQVQALSTPELMTTESFSKELSRYALIPVVIEKIDIPKLTAEKRVTADKINRIVFSPEKTETWADLIIRNLTVEELKLLRALILYDKKDLCHIASGIFADLLNSTDLEVKVMSEFHLGSCLYEMNLPTEALHHLEKVIISQNPQWTQEAIRIALKKVKSYQEEELVQTILKVKDEKLFIDEFKPEVYYLEAKDFAKKQKYDQALNYAEKVPKGHTRYYKAQYLASLAEHFLGKNDSSISRAKNLVHELKKKDSDPDLLALAQVHLGRISFQKGKYKDSMESYQQISKNNNLWIQALTEQGWAQIQSKDLSGAIGNMHSIQSPFFDSVYKPESYIVRSIGYLSMCQYADSYKTLFYLDKKYQPWLERLSQYNKSHDADGTYMTVSKYIEQKEKTEVGGLPLQVLKDAARQKNYLNLQESINMLIDENSGYSFIMGIVDRDKHSLSARKHQASVQVESIKQKINIAQANKLPDSKKKLAQLKAELLANQDFLGIYDFKMNTYREGEEGFKKLSRRAQERVQGYKNNLKLAAGKVLKSHFLKMAKHMRESFDNNELLKYEIFAGSGENLRYQVSGGKVIGVPKNIERKIASERWDFDGEFWEDEIGHYKSALKNECKRN